MKKFLMSLSLLVVSVAGMFGVKALGTQYYDFTVPPLGTKYLVSAVNAVNPIYKYAVNKVTTYSGSATVYSTYQALYNGSYIESGNQLAISTVNTASVWRPSAYNTFPSSYAIASYATCHNVQVTSTHCVLANVKYRLKFKNKNILSEYKIDGIFDYTN